MQYSLIGDLISEDRYLSYRRHLLSRLNGYLGTSEQCSRYMLHRHKALLKKKSVLTHTKEVPENFLAILELSPSTVVRSSLHLLPESTRLLLWTIYYLPAMRVHEVQGSGPAVGLSALGACFLSLSLPRETDGASGNDTLILRSILHRNYLLRRQERPCR